MRSAPSQRAGASGEETAACHLEKQGFTILARNYRCRFGELDIVADEEGTLVFVEVKERHGHSHGEACDAVNWNKRRRIVRAARAFVGTRGIGEIPMRFDVIAIDWDSAGAPRIRHDRGAFDADAR